MRRSGRIGAGLLNLLLVSALGGGLYWLSRQDWSTDGEIDTTESGGSLSKRDTAIFGLSWSANGNTFLSRSLGDAGGGFSLGLHRLAGAGAPPIVSTGSLFPGTLRAWNALLVPDASAVIVATEFQKIERMDVASGSCTELRSFSPSDRIPPLAIAADGSALAIALFGAVLLCDPRTGIESSRLASRVELTKSLLFSTDGTLVAAGYGDGTCRVWNRATGEILHDFGRHNAPVAALGFVDGQTQLATVGLQGDDTLRLWDIDSGELLWSQRTDHCGMCALAVSPDSHIAATGGNNHTILLWDLRERVRLGACTGHEGPVQALHFSPDGTLLTSAASDGTICVWDVQSTELVYLTEIGANIRSQK